MSKVVMNSAELVYLIAHGTWSNEELNSFAEAIRYRRAQMQRAIRRTLQTGDSVKFTNSRNGRTYTGTVERVKIKNVIVRSSGQLWNVPANMLEAA